ncbi:hypothetical protein BV25DRAFT_1835452 [Artomyces pyxidatus]|uniref:Uncharacterized protein n=1 Tax=Artomyces pyxidatus TaxID=48021 RepID=A0ACB8TFG9_9AGAM|nr:hypothetical protein BV25DRAFT_1835452 [Artomyces pyxidatus]
MSLIQVSSGNGLIRDRWPNSIARIAQDVKEFEDMGFHETVPATFEALCRWAYVVIPTDRGESARGYALLYQPADPSVIATSRGRGVEVLIRFQGFLGQSNLKPLGNWKGRVHQLTPSSRTPDSAHKALQFIELKGGPFTAQMGAQISCVERLRTFIFRQLLTTEDVALAERTARPIGDSISLQRRVFTKVHDGPESPPSVLTVMDDPNGLAARISRFWRVTSKLEFGKKTPTGSVERCNQLEFVSGDFVDVFARVDITNAHTEHGVPTVKVFLTPMSVVRLCGAGDVAEVMGVESVNPISQTISPLTGVVEPFVGLVFN